MQAKGDGWDPVKSSVIQFWPFQGGDFTVVRFANCYVVFHFLMFFFFNNVYVNDIFS